MLQELSWCVFFPSKGFCGNEERKAAPCKQQLGNGITVTEVSQACIEQGDNENRRILRQHHCDDLQIKCLEFHVLCCTDGQWQRSEQYSLCWLFSLEQISWIFFFAVLNSDILSLHWKKGIFQTKKSHWHRQSCSVFYTDSSENGAGERDGNKGSKIRPNPESCMI